MNRQVGHEAHPLDHRARDQGRRDDAERRLEHEENQVRDRLALARLEADVLEERVVEVADEAAALAERQRVADGAQVTIATRDRRDRTS